MEIDNVIAERIYASYIGQDCGYNFPPTLTVETTSNEFISIRTAMTLKYPIHVKPLSSISDEDAIVVGRFIMDFKNLENGRAFIKEMDQGKPSSLNFHPLNTFKVFLYLQSKGYALPFMEYSVKDLVNAKIYTLING